MMIWLFELFFYIFFFFFKQKTAYEMRISDLSSDVCSSDLRVLVVQFDPKGTVSNVARHGMEDVVDIAMVRDKTPTLGRKTGFFQDLFGNIGAVGAGGAGAGGPGDTP